MTEYLSLEDLLALTDDLGVGPVRDLGLLDSAAHRPQTELIGYEAYTSLDEKAAVLVESIVSNDPLVDGNKRLAWVSVSVFYGLNGEHLEAPDDDAYNLVVAMASGELGYREAAPRLAHWH